MSIVNKKVIYAFYKGEVTPENRVEGTGVVMDKVRLADRIPSPEGIQILQHDIYLIKNDVGDAITVHPSNIIKIM